MFAFISKLLPRRQQDSSAKISSAAANQIAQQIAVHQNRQKNQEELRHAYLQKILAAANNEVTSIELLLECDFADGRFHAAQAVHTAAGLERVKLAMRNSDKRVAKLMQTRLDEIHREAQNLNAAHECIAQAENLLKQEILLANQVGDLDKQVAQILIFPAAQRTLFDEKRQQLAAQLAMQASLQREVLDLVAAIDAVEDHGSATLSAQIDVWELALTAGLAQTFAAALPKNLVVEASQKLVALRKNWLTSQARLKVRDSGAENEIDAELGSGADVIVNQSADDNTRMPTEKIAKQGIVKLRLSMAEIEVALVAFESALEQGSIQNARKFDRELRDVDTKSQAASGETTGITNAQKERLLSARKELGNMLSWAKWSGNVSRDELVATAEGLANLSLNPKELVGTVSALRDQWKQMEANGGGAGVNKALWERFDAACSAAYAPAAQHFQEQAAMRKTNLQQAEQLLASVQQQAQDLLQGDLDWKAINLALSNMRLEWKKIGHLDRKDKQRLDDMFGQVQNALRTPLAAHQALEISLREKLIVEAQHIDATQKNAIDQLKALQERWKNQAIATPLARKDEQALWERFRAACDAVFEQRKQASASADQQRQENLTTKTQLCERLERCELRSKTELQKELQQCALVSRGLGQIPRDSEAALEQRYQAATSLLKQRIANLEAQESRTGAEQLLQDLTLCQRLDNLLAADISTDTLQQEKAAVEEQWKSDHAARKSKPSSMHVSLKNRFELTLQTLEGDSVARAVRVETMHKNLPKSDDLILHLEILLGVQSPETHSRERLKKQVEVLQTSLKSGNEQEDKLALLAQILGLPVSLDSERQERLEKIMKAGF